MKTLFFSLLVITIFAACDKSIVPPGTPACIRQIITDNKSNPNWEVGLVEEYEFQGSVVYAFQPDNRIIADGATRVVTNDCKELCYVGGFGGPDIMLCNGENFYKNAMFKREIWNKY